MFPLLALVSLASAQDEDFKELLTQAKGSLLAGDYKDARDTLVAAEEAAASSDRVLTQREVARIFFYRGVVYWRASPESSALEAWRQALTIDPDFQPEPDVLGDSQDQDAFHALRDEVVNRGELSVDLPEDPGEAVIYIDGRTLEPEDSVIAGTHLIQIKCEGGDVKGAWYAYGRPPSNYLTICDGGAYKSGSRTSSSSSSSSSSKPSSSSGKKDDKPEKSGGETAKNVAGVSLIGLSAVGGVVSYLLYDQAAIAADAYEKKKDAAVENPDLREPANKYYDEVVIPRYFRFYGASIASGVVLAAGVTLVILDADGPMIVPTPGGAAVTWSGHF